MLPCTVLTSLGIGYVEISTWSKSSQADSTLTVRMWFSQLLTPGAKHTGHVFQFMLHISLQIHHFLLTEKKTHVILLSVLGSSCCYKRQYITVLRLKQLWNSIMIIYLIYIVAMPIVLKNVVIHIIIYLFLFIFILPYPLTHIMLLYFL